ncbi:MAG: BCSC C-terminal domain-containing protein [Pseudomonadaceae bacterium]|nr:BCSC C-terminal domain-containing protein [Pseudomonadaceae bacterium]
MLRHHTLALGLLTTLIHTASFAASDDPRTLLIEQGLFWQAEDNSGRAGEAWQKLLLIDAQHPDALYGLGLIDLKANRLASANDYLVKLKALTPLPRKALQLEQDISLARAENIQRLEQARLFSAADEKQKAVAVYREMFAGRQPQGLIAREYYNTLAFTDAGWSEAHSGLVRLRKERPDDSLLALMLAQQLARRESSRAEGIRALATLSTRADIGGAADENWRMALTWIGPPNSAQAPLFEQFLKAHPDDAEIRALLNKGKAQGQNGGAKWQQNPQLARAFKALDQADYATAEREFLQRLQAQPNDADALGGLGVVRQQQQRFEDAEVLLVRATKQKGGAQWQKALVDVRYWSLLDRATKAHAQGDKSQARNLINEAVRLNPKQPAGKVAQADLQAESGELVVAESAYRQVLAQHPNNSDAQRGLINVLTLAGKSEEALRMIDTLPKAEQSKNSDVGRLRASQLVQRAKLAEQRGDLAGARKGLEEALRNDPNDPWTRFALANIYLKSGAVKEARSLVDGLLVTQPKQPDALYTSALLSAQLGEWNKAQATLGRIAPSARTPAMNKLLKDIEFNIKLPEATALIKRGRLREAHALLARIEPYAAGQPGMVAQLALAYVDAGDPQHGIKIMRQQVAQSPRPSPELLLQYAGVLLKGEQDVEVNAILHDLQDQPLNSAARKQYDDILFYYRVRQANRLREAGDLVAAYDTLAPALTQRPENELAQASLAKMYGDGGDAVQALTIYRPLLQRAPDNAQLQIAAAEMAAKVGDHDFAETALSKTIELAPEDPKLLTLAASIYNRIGMSGKAKDLMEKVVAQEHREKTAALAAQTPASRSAANPFLGLPGQRSAANAQATAAQIPSPTVVTPRAPTAQTIPVAIPAVVQTDAWASERSIAPVAAAELPADAYPGQSYAAPAKPRSYSSTPTYSWQKPAPEPVEAVQGSRVNPFAPAASAELAAVDPRQGMSPAERALDDIVQARSPYVVQGLTVRSNNGESGLSKMTDVQAPLEASMPVGDNRLVLRVTPVSLNADSVDSDAAARFGGGPAASQASPNVSIGSQKDSGVGFAVAFESPSEGLKADLGTTPQGFLYSTAVGGVSLERSFGGNSDAHYGVSLSRRAVTDSVLSFAGTEDPRTGQKWGGVTANGGRAQVSQDDGDMGSYAYGSWHKLVGNNVESNNRAELGGGVYWYLQNESDSQLTAGLNMSAVSYDENLSYYTYGHGGYFSPQRFFALGVPVSWAQRRGKLSYKIRGSVGVQHIEQDKADYFPGDATMQANATTALGSPAVYGSDNSTGVGYNLAAAAEYQLNPNLFIGGELGSDNAQDYQQFNGGMYLRYMLEDMTRPVDMPVSPYRSPYSN